MSLLTIFLSFKVMAVGIFLSGNIKKNCPSFVR